MTYYRDLSECGYFSRHAPLDSSRLIAVGWLDTALPSAFVDPATLGTVVDDLVRIEIAQVDLWGVSLGFHGCGLCGLPSDRAPATEVVHKGQHMSLGSGYITVPGDGFLYVAPSLIIHYILAHGYEPPPAFCTALARCPNPRSRAYLRAVQREGPPWLSDEFGHPLGSWRSWIAANLTWKSFQRSRFRRHLRRVVRRY